MTDRTEPASKNSNSMPAGSSGSSKSPSERVLSIFTLEATFPLTSTLLLPHGIAGASGNDVLVAFDTNALLLPYNIGRDDLTALATVYRKLAREKRLYVPARVIREFIKNRDAKLAEMVQGLNDKKSTIKAPESKLSPLLEGVRGYDKIHAAAKKMEDARKDYIAAYDNIIKQIRDWRGDDPVTSIYNEVFSEEVIIENNQSREDLLSEWDYRSRHLIPPGYKDIDKPDSGIGDFLIWKSLLKIGEVYKKDLIFVTGEQKGDWQVRSGNEGVFPRPELIDEYNRFSKGKNIRLSTLHSLLKEMEAPESVVSEVREAEATANLSVYTTSSGLKVWTKKRRTLLTDNPHYMAFYCDSRQSLSDGYNTFIVEFSKGSISFFYVYGTTAEQKLYQISGISPEQVLNLEALPNPVKSVRVCVGELFVVVNPESGVLIARVIDMSGDMQDPKGPLATIHYHIYSPGELVIAP